MPESEGPLQGKYVSPLGSCQADSWQSFTWDRLLEKAGFVASCEAEVTKSFSQFLEAIDFVIPDLIRNPVFTWIPAFDTAELKCRNG
jgi:hypothetical protein